MKAIVVFESMFGNTKAVAWAVTEGLGRYGEVDVVNVDDAAGHPADDVRLVVAGGPTHAFGMTRPRTRTAAGEQATAPLVSRRTGLREWLDGLPPARPAAFAAAFDTRMARPRWLPGAAARGAAKRLRGHGYGLVVPPEGFTVEGTPGPLTDGELERARDWGAWVGAAWTARTGSAS